MGSDPFTELPAGLLSELEGFVYGDPTWNAQHAKIYTLKVLIEKWQEILPDDALVRTWIDRWRGSDYILKPNEQSGDLEELDPRLGSSSPYVIPQELLRQLVDDGLALPIDQRVPVVVSLWDVINEWEGQFVDDEKLVGHLFLAHGVEGAELTQAAEALIARHATAHRG